MYLRESPLRFGLSPIGLYTLVAMTTSSRRAKSCSARPKTSSLSPSEYMSAVSKKLMPSFQRALDKGPRGLFVQHPIAPLR